MSLSGRKHFTKILVDAGVFWSKWITNKESGCLNLKPLLCSPYMPKRLQCICWVSTYKGNRENTLKCTCVLSMKWCTATLEFCTNREVIWRAFFFPLNHCVEVTARIHRFGNWKHTVLCELSTFKIILYECHIFMIITFKCRRLRCTFANIFDIFFLQSFLFMKCFFFLWINILALHPDFMCWVFTMKKSWT